MDHLIKLMRLVHYWMIVWSSFPSPVMPNMGSCSSRLFPCMGSLQEAFWVQWSNSRSKRLEFAFPSPASFIAREQMAGPVSWIYPSQMALYNLLVNLIAAQLNFAQRLPSHSKTDTAQIALPCQTCALWQSMSGNTATFPTLRECWPVSNGLQLRRTLEDKKALPNDRHEMSPVTSLSRTLLTVSKSQMRRSHITEINVQNSDSNAICNVLHHASIYTLIKSSMVSVHCIRSTHGICHLRLSSLDAIMRHTARIAVNMYLGIQEEVIE